MKAGSRQAGEEVVLWCLWLTCEGRVQASWGSSGAGVYGLLLKAGSRQAGVVVVLWCL